MSEEKRSARIERRTTETQIDLELCLDGGGECRVETGIGFFDHMLNAFARHGLFDLVIQCQGDLDVDAHHTVEDVGICLGQAIDQALGDKPGNTLCGMSSEAAQGSVRSPGMQHSTYLYGPPEQAASHGLQLARVLSCGHTTY